MNEHYPTPQPPTADRLPGRPSGRIGEHVDADTDSRREDEIRAGRRAYLLDSIGVNSDDLDDQEAQLVNLLSAQNEPAVEAAGRLIGKARRERLSFHESCPSCGSEERRLFRLAPAEERPQLTHPEAAAELLVPLLSGLDREHCLLVSLDVKHRVIAVTTASIGSVDHTFIAPREIFRDALLHGAAAIMLAHNHPSGDATASADDRQVTRRIAGASSLVGIQLLDHLIVGRDTWTSLARDGVL